MIPIQRIAEPEVLEKNKEQWTAEYLARRETQSSERPRSNRYAHRDIVFALEAMSNHKCFYCEQSTKAAKAQVDHYIEVAEKPELAYEWKNLYLSYPDCNKHKLRNRTIPVTSCLDPCDLEEIPSKHLCFDAELIRARNGSDRGLNSIKKYRLDRADLDYKRLKQVQIFDRVLDHIRQTQISEGRKKMTAKEEELLRSFAQKDRPFSLMFAFYLEQIGF